MVLVLSSMCVRVVNFEKNWVWSRVPDNPKAERCLRVRARAMTTCLGKSVIAAISWSGPTRPDGDAEPLVIVVPDSDA